MFDHVSIGVSDIARAKRFYDAALAPLGYTCLRDSPALLGYGGDEVALWISPTESPVRLNPNSHLLRTGLSRLAGLQRAHVSLGRVPPGKDSFAYHSHMVEEEWIYILSGRGLADIDAKQYEVGPGDFMGFPAPGTAHLL